MAMVRIHNHMIDLSRVFCIDIVRHNKKVVNYISDKGATIPQVFPTEEEALFVANRVWEIFCSRDDNPIDITPEIKKQDFPTFEQVEEDEKLKKMIELEKLEKENKDD